MDKSNITSTRRLNYYGTPDTWSWQHPDIRELLAQRDRNPPGARLIRNISNKVITAQRGAAQEERCGLCQPKVVQQICSQCITTFSPLSGALTNEECRKIHEELHHIYDTERARLFHQTFLARGKRKKGTALLRHRKALDLTQAKLAKRWNMSRSLLAMMENGTRPIPAHIQRVLNVTRKGHGPSPCDNGYFEPRKIEGYKPSDESSEITDGEVRAISVR